MKRSIFSLTLLLVMPILMYPQGELLIKPMIKPTGNPEHAMVNIGLDKESREKSAQLLRVLLANEYLLYIKTQKFHWNVTGPFFGPLHSMFQTQYEQLAEIVDVVAERSLALGHPAIGTLKEFLDYATLTEKPGLNPSADEMVAELLTDYETIIKKLRADLDDTANRNDLGTNNMFNDLLEKHEKTAWILRVHLQK